MSEPLSFRTRHDTLVFVIAAWAVAAGFVIFCLVLPAFRLPPYGIWSTCPGGTIYWPFDFRFVLAQRTGRPYWRAIWPIAGGYGAVALAAMALAAVRRCHLLKHRDGSEAAVESAATPLVAPGRCPWAVRNVLLARLLQCDCQLMSHCSGDLPVSASRKPAGSGACRVPARCVFAGRKPRLASA